MLEIFESFEKSISPREAEGTKHDGHGVEISVLTEVFECHDS